MMLRALSLRGVPAFFCKRYRCRLHNESQNIKTAAKLREL
jgi:hypothetical protein